jgi:hypothetical protein
MQLPHTRTLINRLQYVFFYGNLRNLFLKALHKLVCSAEQTLLQATQMFLDLLRAHMPAYDPSV